MDSSATRTKAINLGNELVKALDLEPGGNTLTRWMAHYLAEQITLAETTSGALKTAAEDRCFKTVLALWQQRSSLPSGRRPLEDCEPILHTLERLDPDERRPFFHRLTRAEEANTDEEKIAVIKLLRFVESVDVAARILIELALQSAAEQSASAATKALLSQALPGKPEADVKVLRRLLKQDEKGEADGPAAEAKRLAKRLEQLDWFGEVCKKVRASYAIELKKLEKQSKQTAS